MKRSTFKICILMLITSVSMYAQRKTVYSESFSVDKQTTAIFNLENTTVAIEESRDGKIHFDYTLEFDGYSKKDIKNKLDELDIRAIMFDNHVTLAAKSESQLSKVNYVYDVNELVIEYDGFSKSKDSIMRKSKDSIIREIQSNGRFGKFANAMQYVDNRFKVKDKDGKLRKIRKGDVKIMRNHFVIRIPSFLKLKINGKNAQITMLENTINELSVELKRGYFNAKELLNDYNSFKINDANFKSEGLVGGNYEFNNVSQGLIGSIQEVKITSEFSKIEIGEIREKAFITDFNSEYWFYNWSKDFKRFDLLSEYSKIHFFYPETYDFSMKFIGNNTVNHFDNIAVTMQPTKNGEKFNMVERKAKGEGHFSGAINFDIVHGIIYTANDTFIKPKQ
ncbi:hypothetical protein [Psychroserpens luteolus]|uniref:hypothetical protein n=1 Tax=Psychroserpens luteolus TaxID=2855840 RepID=UPI001E5E5493|nr:hypothetical protein [Psychroserpens luteolus]MCD2260001.1 hypothetical protein [Psychroserpens luteolus]